MAYIRQKGNQLVLVHGSRDKDTQKVYQEILFTIYSKGEALEVIGCRKNKSPDTFQYLIERRYPNIKFNWKKIKQTIRESLSILPDMYEYKKERLSKNFKQDLRACLRQLILTDPQDMISSAQLIEEHRYEFEFLIDLVKWRLETSKNKEKNEWNGDNSFYWFKSLQPSESPPETEEMAEEMYLRGDYNRAEAIFKLLTEIFDNYAEGYNYLGLISLARHDLEKAADHFNKTIELGLKLFPRRIAKSDYWSNHDTRPYMRGLRNLALVLNRSGKFDEALDVCDKLDEECGDDIVARCMKSDIYLNLDQWRLAIKHATYDCNTFPDNSFNVAFANFELGNTKEANTYFLHATLHYPKTANALVGIHIKNTPKTHEECDDHNCSIDVCQNLHKYLKQKSRPSLKHFKEFILKKDIQDLVQEKIKATHEWMANREAGPSVGYKRMQEMGKIEFAQKEVGNLMASAG
ncbi:MAG: hypothetical protein HQM16_03525 [Deltaproteobacteria bacterium]|nr:hypothetical protein [Deltaproteobacteria bacterium]